MIPSQISVRNMPIKLTSDLRIIAPADAPPLSGKQALDLGRRLIQQGAIKIALEAVDRGDRLPRARGAAGQ
jgi:hypothetical protein